MRSPVHSSAATCASDTSRFVFLLEGCGADTEMRVEVFDKDLLSVDFLGCVRAHSPSFPCLGWEN